MEHTNLTGDFLIVGGQMDAKDGIVTSFRVLSRAGLNLGIPVRASRKEVVDALKENYVFLVSPDQDPENHHFAKVKMVMVNGKPFLRTDDKMLPADYIEGVDIL